MRAPRTILFGWDAVQATGPAASDFGATALVCTDEQILASDGGSRLRSSLASAGVHAEYFAAAAPELPRSSIDQCLQFARSVDPDVVIGFGGGSAMDLAKVTALGLTHAGELDQYVGEGRVPGPIAPLIAVPSTAGTGSEVSPVAVVPDAAGTLKVGISSPALIPAVAICDPQTTLGCPRSVTAFAGLDALVHAVESYTAAQRLPDWADYPGPVFRGANPLTAELALSAVSLIGRSFERVLDVGDDREARAEMLMGSLKAGLSFAQAGNAGVHALQYPVGAQTHTPHGLGVALLAPYVFQYVLPSASQAFSEVAAALISEAAEPSPIPSAQMAVDEIARLVEVAGVPRSLAELGIEHGQLSGVAREATSIERLLRNSPRRLQVDDLERILEAAWNGDREPLKEGALK
jgi:alcohol dehydrogenase class IV